MYLEILRGDPIAARMLVYVKGLLSPVDSLSKNGLRLPFRSRFAHIERVAGWALNLSEAEGGDIGVIAVASIFHDAGYRYGGEGHARRSATVFEEYTKTERVITVDDQSGVQAETAGLGTVDSAEIEQATPALAGAVEYAGIIQPALGVDGQNRAGRLRAAIGSAMSSEESRVKIRNVIALHSDKHLHGTELNPEAAVLMDADMLDEAGAMAVLFDCFFEAASPNFDYNGAYERVLARYGADAGEAARFHTGEGLRQHMTMRRYVGEFIKGLGNELGR